MNLRQSADPFGLDAAYRDASAPPKSKTGKGKKPFYKRVSFWFFITLLVVCVGVRIALNPLASHFTQQGLDQIPGYAGKFESVKVSIIPFTYTITDLSLLQDGQKEPVVYAHEIQAQLFWRKLIRLQAVATASIIKAKFTFKAGITKPPPSDKKAEPPKEVDLSEALNQIIPFRIDRVEVRDSEVNVVDSTDPKSPNFWVKDIELVIENLVSRKKLDENVPLSLTMRAVVAKTGILKIIANADLLAEKPAFTGEAQLSGLSLESLYEWTAAKAGISASGTVDAFVNFNSAKGKLSGDVKVLIRNPKVKPSDDKLSDVMKAKLAGAAIKILSDRVEGRDAIGTTMPIKGTLAKPDPQIYPMILGVVRNAFIQGLDWGFSDIPSIVAEKKEGPIAQAADALNKDKPGVKAQPPAEKK